jgi:hypothetical protein
MKPLLSRIYLAFIISLGLFVTCPELVALAKEYTISGQTSQKLYESSSENSKAVANVIPGNSFTILETVKDSQGRNWHHVLLSGGVDGYVIASRVIEVEEPEEQQAATEEENADDDSQEDEQHEQENVEYTQEEPEGEENNLENENTDNNEETNEEVENEGLANVSVTILSNTNLRDEPTLEGNILIVIPGGVTIRPLEKIESGNFYWYRLTYLTQTGFIMADAVEEVVGETEEDEVIADAATEESSSVTYKPKIVNNSSTSTVSYEDSYDRRHKWDNPEIPVKDEKIANKRILDIYTFIFLIFASALMIVGIFLLENATRSMRKSSQKDKKRRKKH